MVRSGQWMDIGWSVSTQWEIGGGQRVASKYSNQCSVSGQWVVIGNQ